jgi:hypothetical protein
MSFKPSTEKAVSNTRPGFYIFVEDFTDRTYHKFIVESRDSVDNIFNRFFHSELELGDVDHPITIYNGKHNFYIARVTVFETSDGRKKFRNLKYADVYKKRSRLKPVTL